MNKKKKFTFALLGIDGSGKSTIAKELKIWLTKEGFKVKIIPFHYYLFANKLKQKTWKFVDKGRPRFDRPYEPDKKSLAAIIKPIIAFIDNLLFYIHNFPDGKRYDIVIFDRFICSTGIKFYALSYRTDWFKPIWWNITTDFAVVFDISEDVSIERQLNRGDPYLYTKIQLSKERELYKEFALDHNFLLINNETTNLKKTLYQIKKALKWRKLI